MKIISKTNLSIRDIKENKFSMYPNYAKLSDAQFDAIKSLEYQDGTYIDDIGNEVPNMVDLKLIESLTIEDDLVTSINFKDRVVAIQEYEDTKVNQSYHNFKHHIEIYDLTLLCLLVPELVSRIEELKTADGSLTKYISKQIQNPVDKKFITVVNLYIDNKEIEGIEQLVLLATTDFNGNSKNLVTIHPDNPVWGKFNNTQAVE